MKIGARFELHEHNKTLSVHFPLYTPKGQIRVKRPIENGESVPVYSRRHELKSGDYIEWQIGYDTADFSSLSRIDELVFERNGSTRYGFELAWLIKHAVDFKLIDHDAWSSVREAIREIDSGIERKRPLRCSWRTFGRINRIIQNVTIWITNGDVRYLNY